MFDSPLQRGDRQAPGGATCRDLLKDHRLVFAKHFAMLS